MPPPSTYHSSDLKHLFNTIAVSRPGRSNETISGAMPQGYKQEDLGVMRRAEFLKAYVNRTLDTIFGCRIYNRSDNSRVNTMWDTLISFSILAEERGCGNVVRKPYVDFRMSMGNQFKQSSQLLKVGWMYGAGSKRVRALIAMWAKEDEKQDTLNTLYDVVAPPVAPPVSPPVAPPVAVPVAVPVAPPVAPPVSPPVAPPETTPVAPPVAPSVVPPVAPPVATPEAPPVATPPVAPPVSPQVKTPMASPVAMASRSRRTNIFKSNLSVNSVLPPDDVPLAFEAFRKTKTPITTAGPSGFVFVCKKRVSGASAGGLDFYAYSHCGKRFRSKKELCAFWGK